MVVEIIAQLQRHTARAGEVLGTLAKYGLADWLSGIDQDWLQNRLRTHEGERLREMSTPARMRHALTDLGTAFIKFGQVLSTRPDVVGNELAAELAQLQASTRPDPPEVARATIEAELGRPPERLFDQFAAEAFASASIAQVHRGTLHDGRAVVVKIMRAGVAERAHMDLEILQTLARLAERYAPSLRPFQPVALARQFQRVLQRELDFGFERRNLEAFLRNFGDDPSVHFPAVHPSLCSRRVLTMEELVGIPGTDQEALRRSGTDLAAFARRGADLFLEMIFRDSFYHADPHPGNLMLLPGGVVGLLDCGMVGRVDEELRREIEAMLLAATENDVDQLAEALLRLGASPPDADRRQVRTDLAEILTDYVGQPLREVPVGDVLGSITDLVRRHRILLPAQLSMLLRTLVVLEGTSRRLAHDFSLAELMGPFCERVLQRRYSPRQVLHRLRRSARDWNHLLDVLPRDIAELLATLRRGSLRMRLDHRHLDVVVNRLVLGVLVAALLLGGSELWSRGAPPLLGSVSLLGLVCYLLALHFGWRLLRGVRRSGDVGSRDDGPGAPGR